MSRTERRKAMKELGVKRTNKDTQDDEILNLAEAYKKQQPTTDSVLKQLNRNISKVQDVKVLKKMAKDLGIKVKEKVKASTLRKAIVKAQLKQFDVGFTVTQEAFNVSSKLLSRASKVNGVKLEFDSKIDQALFSLTKNYKNKSLKRIRNRKSRRTFSKIKHGYTKTSRESKKDK